jgi:hypothetical protein
MQPSFLRRVYAQQVLARHIFARKSCRRWGQPPSSEVALLCVLLLAVSLGAGGALAGAAPARSRQGATTSAVTVPRPFLAAAPLPTQAPPIASQWPILTSAPVAPIAATPAIPFAARDFEAGVAFPRWTTSGYSGDDAGWQTGLDEIQRQTGAQWIEMMIQLYQDSTGATWVQTGPTTPSPASLADGIRQAHAQGLHVFVVPLLGVLHGQPWGGAVRFGGYNEQHAWFASYWNALEPYLAAAADAGAEQFAIGTELSGMEAADSSLWTYLLGAAHVIFGGKLTYDVNWSTLGAEPRGWMRSSALAYLGVSEYAPLARGGGWLSPDQVATAWQRQILPSLDRISAAAGKPVIVSETGYRNAADALYQPWDHGTRARPDPSLQAAAYEGALRAVYAAPHVAGLFFWAWSVQPFAPNNLPAAKVLRTYYTALPTYRRPSRPFRREPTSAWF